MKNNVQKKDIVSILYKLAIFWFLIGYIILPIFYTLSEAVTLDEQKDWSVIGEFLMNPKNQIVIVNTLKLGIITVIICGLIGVSMAFFMTFHCTRFKKAIHLM